jgi:predicted aspartyl protease
LAPEVPLFTYQHPNLQQVGPVIQIHLAVTTTAAAAIRAAGGTAATPVAVWAMIDTGASCCVIQRGLAQQLGLQPTGQVPTTTPSSTNVLSMQYPVQLVFPDQSTQEVIAVEMELHGQHVQCLIGRDLLAGGTLIYSGIQNAYTLYL